MLLLYEALLKSVIEPINVIPCYTVWHWRWPYRNSCTTNKAINRHDSKLRTICERHQYTAHRIRIVAFIFQTFCYFASFMTFDVNSICLCKYFFIQFHLSSVCVCMSFLFASFAFRIHDLLSRMNFSPAVSHISDFFASMLFV